MCAASGHLSTIQSGVVAPGQQGPISTGSPLSRGTRTSLDLADSSGSLPPLHKAPPGKPLSNTNHKYMRKRKDRLLLQENTQNRKTRLSCWASVCREALIHAKFCHIDSSRLPEWGARQVFLLHISLNHDPTRSTLSLRFVQDTTALSFQPYCSSRCS